jgi:hypothetical protein
MYNSCQNKKRKCSSLELLAKLLEGSDILENKIKTDESYIKI